MWQRRPSLRLSLQAGGARASCTIPSRKWARVSNTERASLTLSQLLRTCKTRSRGRALCSERVPVAASWEACPVSRREQGHQAARRWPCSTRSILRTTIGRGRGAVLPRCRGACRRASSARTETTRVSARCWTQGDAAVACYCRYRSVSPRRFRSECVGTLLLFPSGSLAWPRGQTALSIHEHLRGRADSAQRGVHNERRYGNKIRFALCARARRHLSLHRRDRPVRAVIPSFFSMHC